MKPQQLELFEPAKLIQRDTRGQSLIDLADWTFQHGPGRLTRRERGFLFGILNQQAAISLNDAAEVHRLHAQIGKQQEKPNV